MENVVLIARGAKDFFDSINSLESVSGQIKLQAKELYEKIIFTAFDWQRQGIVDELSRKEDEEIRQRTDVGLPKLPSAEINKMVSKLKKEMREAAEAMEYERAAQMRDRIKELKQYSSDDLKTIATSNEGNKEFDLSA